MHRTIHVWYFPSNYGDIRLEDVGAGERTRVIWYKLTSAEAVAMTALRKASIHGLRRWATAADWDKLGDEIFEAGSLSEHHLDLKAPLDKVAKVLTKVLRPDRQTVHVMRIGGGKIEEIRGGEFDEPPGEVKQSADPKGDVTPLRKDADETPAETTALAKTGTDDATPVKAATVKKPTRGCPAPSFESVRLRATRVLRAFLTPQQVVDFERHQRFVTVGADTGHRYMLTSRNAPDELANYGSRCVFDLDEGRPFCVHDWDVPAEEELLSLHCLLSLPGYEDWARGMPDEDYVRPLPPGAIH